jgi:hypothetical protein
VFISAIVFSAANSTFEINCLKILSSMM